MFWNVIEEDLKTLESPLFQVADEELMFLLNTLATSHCSVEGWLQMCSNHTVPVGCSTFLYVLDGVIPLLTNLCSQMRDEGIPLTECMTTILGRATETLTVRIYSRSYHLYEGYFHPPIVGLPQGCSVTSYFPCILQWKFASSNWKGERDGVISYNMMSNKLLLYTTWTVGISNNPYSLFKIRLCQCPRSQENLLTVMMVHFW